LLDCLSASVFHVKHPRACEPGTNEKGPLPGPLALISIVDAGLPS